MTLKLAFVAADHGAEFDVGVVIRKELERLENDAWMDAYHREGNGVNLKSVHGADAWIVPFASVGASRKSLWNRETFALFQL